MLKKLSQKQELLGREMKNLSVKISRETLIRAIDFFILQKKAVLTMDGFQQGFIPSEYIKTHYLQSLHKHIEKVFYNFYVKDMIFKQLRNEGVYVSKHINVVCHFSFKDFSLEYEYSYYNRLLDYNVMPDFKKLKFPERKKYRDLDKQTKQIIEGEEEKKRIGRERFVLEGDWVGIEVYFSDGKSIFDDSLKVKLWIYVSSENIDKEIRLIFCGKKLGEGFFTNACFLNDFLSTDFLVHTFYVRIESHVPTSFFCIDSFKVAFKYDNKDVFNKIVELFSLRKDITLRKEKIQIILKYFLEKIKIFFDNTIIVEHEFVIKSQVSKNPDYLLYQSDKNFEVNIKRLACAQIMEKILVDYFIALFDVELSDCLIYSYLNILQRHRLKDFLYFDFAHVSDNFYCTMPIHNSVIEHAALREKTVDFLMQKFDF